MSIDTSRSWPEHQFLRFLIVGFGNTLIGLTVIYAAKALLGADDVVANATGYAVGLAVSFVLNKSWTFRHEGDALVPALKFLTVFAFSYTLNLSVVLGSIHGLGIDSYLAQALGIPPYTIMFFLLSRSFAFRPAD